MSLRPLVKKIYDYEKKKSRAMLVKNEMLAAWKVFENLFSKTALNLGNISLDRVWKNGFIDRVRKPNL